MRVRVKVRDCALCLGKKIAYDRKLRRYVCAECGDTMVVSQAGTLIYAPVARSIQCAFSHRSPCSICSPE